MSVDPFAILGKTLSLDALSELTKLAGAQFNARLIPGKEFAWDPERKALTYPRARLAEMEGQAGPGKIYHNLGHARFSQTETPLGLAVKRIVASLPQPNNKPLIAESDVLGIIEAAEDERMEMHVRDERPGLGMTYLPRHDDGYRGEAWTQEREAALTEFNLDEAGYNLNGGKDYWKHVATTIRGLVSGAVDRFDLPEQFSWSDELIGAIEDLRNAPSADDLVRSYETIVPLLIKERLDPPEEQNEEQQQQGNGDPDNDQQDEGDASDGGSQSGDGDERSKPPMDPQDALDQLRRSLQNASADALEQLQDEAANGSEVNAAADFISSDDTNADDGTAAGSGGDEAGGDGAGMGHFPPRDAALPTWREVLSTVESLLTPLRRAANEAFLPNEQSIMLRRQTRGRLDIRSVIRRVDDEDERLHKRRVVKGTARYGVYLLLDRSGSMSSGLDEDVAFPEVFGTWRGTRAQLAIRLGAALAHTFSQFPSVSFGIGAFDDGHLPVKAVSSHVSAKEKDEAIRVALAQGGGTVIGPSLDAVQREFAAARVDHGLAIILTDGDFCDAMWNGTEYDFGSTATCEERTAALKKRFSDLERSGTSVVILTTGHSEKSALQYTNHASRVVDSNAGAVIASHLRRMARLAQAS